MSMMLVVSSQMPANVTQAAMIIDLPDLVFYVDGTTTFTGSFHAHLTLTDAELASPPQLSTFNIAFDDDDLTDLDLTAAFAAEETPLFLSGSTFTFSAIQKLFFAHDLLDETPFHAPAHNNAGLVKVDFQVPAGVEGVFPLTLDSVFTEITDATGQVQNLTLLPGSISIIIPEPSSFVVVTVFSIFCLAHTRNGK